MEIDEDIQDILRHYRKGDKPNATVEGRIVKLFFPLTPAERGTVIDWLLDHREAYKGLDTAAVRDAMAETGVGKPRDYIRTEEKTCDYCGLAFHYYVQSGDEDKFERDIHDRCPRCGLDPLDTWSAKKELARIGRLPGWYEEKLKDTAQRVEWNGGKWFYDKNEVIAWRNKNESEKREAGREFKEQLERFAKLKMSTVERETKRYLGGA